MGSTIVDNGRLSLSVRGPGRFGRVDARVGVGRAALLLADVG